LKTISAPQNKIPTAARATQTMTNRHITISGNAQGQSLPCRRRAWCEFPIFL